MRALFTIFLLVFLSSCAVSTTSKRLVDEPITLKNLDVVYVQTPMVRASGYLRSKRVTPVINSATQYLKSDLPKHFAPYNVDVSFSTLLQLKTLKVNQYAGEHVLVIHPIRLNSSCTIEGPKSCFHELSNTLILYRKSDSKVLWIGRYDQTGLLSKTKNGVLDDFGRKVFAMVIRHTTNKLSK